MGQMSLFGGRRHRAKPAPPEFAEHVMIADTLRRWVCPGWMWWHTPNEGARTKRVNPRTGAVYSPEGQRLVRMGMRKGVSDFLLVGPPLARLHGWEHKRRGEKPTDEQFTFGADLIAAGGLWAWGDTYDAALETFQRWGALPSTIHVV